MFADNGPLYAYVDIPFEEKKKKPVPSRIVIYGKWPHFLLLKIAALHICLLYLLVLTK